MFIAKLLDFKHKCWIFLFKHDRVAAVRDLSFDVKWVKVQYEQQQQHGGRKWPSIFFVTLLIGKSNWGEDI